MEGSEQGGDGFKYWAFISYSSKDKEVAIRLHKRLESYSIPRDLRGRPGRDGATVPPKIFPVFRDRDELPLSSDLGGTIHGALQASRYLIVLCSPNAASSQWVNEEILHFKRLGREDRILAVILDGEPGMAEVEGRAHEECFPHALKYEMGPAGELTEKRSEPIGGDLRKGGDGWERVFLKAIAGIRGLGFDAFVRRQRKRKRRKQAIGGLVCLLALAAGVWAWDYNRLKVSWYAHAEEQRGVPVGIRLLSEEEVSHRGHNLKFERRRGKVRRVVDINGFGNQVPSEKFGMVEAASLEVIYTEDGPVSEHRLFRRDGREVLRRSYSEGGTVVEFKDPTGKKAQAVSGSVGSLTQRGWGVLDGSGDQEKRTEITRWVVSYDERGNVAKVRYFGVGGEKVLGSDGYHEYRVIHDGRGNQTGWSYYGVEGEGVLPKGDPVHEVRVKYDEAGMERERSFWGADGAGTVDSSGVHRRTYRYDARGKEVERRSFGTDGAAVIDLSDGSHRLASVFDEMGNTLEVTSWGVEDQAVLNQSGYHRRTHSYDEQGNKLTEAYFGADGQPCLRQGWGAHRLEFEYDLFGQELAQRCYGVDGKPVVSTLGYHLLRNEYDGSGRNVSFTYHGVDEKPMNTPAGIHRVSRKFNDRGKAVEWAYFDRDGKATFYAEEGYHRVTYEYDVQGRELWSRYYGVKGEPVMYLGVKGEPVERSGGLHKLKQTFDARGNELSESYFGVDGKAIMWGSTPCHRDESKYDRNGLKEEERFVGVDGEPVADGNGRHMIRWKHDAFGKASEVTYFDVKGEPTMDTRQGFHRMTWKHSAMGQTLEEVFWDTEGKRAAGADGKSRTEWAFDGAGRLTLHVFYGVDDEPVEIGGVARREGSYDAETGELLEVRKFDAAGERVEE